MFTFCHWPHGPVPDGQPKHRGLQKQPAANLHTSGSQPQVSDAMMSLVHYGETPRNSHRSGYSSMWIPTPLPFKNGNTICRSKMGMTLDRVDKLLSVQCSTATFPMINSLSQPLQNLKLDISTVFPESCTEVHEISRTPTHDRPTPLPPPPPLEYIFVHVVTELDIHSVHHHGTAIHYNMAFFCDTPTTLLPVRWYCVISLC